MIRERSADAALGCKVQQRRSGPRDMTRRVARPRRHGCGCSSPPCGPSIHHLGPARACVGWCVDRATARPSSECRRARRAGAATSEPNALRWPSTAASAPPPTSSLEPLGISAASRPAPTRFDRRPVVARVIAPPPLEIQPVSSPGRSRLPAASGIAAADAVCSPSSRPRAQTSASYPPRARGRQPGCGSRSPARSTATKSRARQRRQPVDRFGLEATPRQPPAACLSRSGQHISTVRRAIHRRTAMLTHGLPKICCSFVGGRDR